MLGPHLGYLLVHHPGASTGPVGVPRADDAAIAPRVTVRDRVFKEKGDGGEASVGVGWEGGLYR